MNHPEVVASAQDVLSPESSPEVTEKVGGGGRSTQLGWVDRGKLRTASDVKFVTLPMSPSPAP